MWEFFRGGFWVGYKRATASLLTHLTGVAVGDMLAREFCGWTATPAETLSFGLCK